MPNVKGTDKAFNMETSLIDQEKQFINNLLETYHFDITNNNENGGVIFDYYND